MTETTWVRVCDTALVAPGEMAAVPDVALPPLAVFNLGQRFCVTSNVCTHNQALLTDGFFEHGIVECPLHGGSFNVVSGEPESFPCSIPLPTYEVEVRDGGVYARLPAGLRASA